MELDAANTVLLPDAPGAYAIHLHLPQTLWLQVGRWGEVKANSSAMKQIMQS